MAVTKLLANHRWGKSRRKVILVGPTSNAPGYHAALGRNPGLNGDTVGLISTDPELSHQGNSHEPSSVAVHQAPDNAVSAVTAEPISDAPVRRRVLDLIQQTVVDEVVALGNPFDQNFIEELVPACAETGRALRLLVTLPQSWPGFFRVRDLGDRRCLISLETVPQGALGAAIKRCIDILGSGFGLMLFAAAYGWYGPRIRKQSPGAVLFHQKRIGRNGRPFVIHKFRTMHPDAETRLDELKERNEMNGHMFKLTDDPRIFPLGQVLRRRYLDELPQFWNVLKGEMSLVGTRPPTPSEVAHYEPRHLRRLSIKPGITGLWQLEGNRTVNDFEEVVRLDCAYIDNWSLWLDFKILLRTLKKLFKGGGC